MTGAWFPIVMVCLTVVLPLVIIMHYTTKWKATQGLSDDEQALYQRLKATTPELFDPATGTWTAAAPLGRARAPVAKQPSEPRREPGAREMGGTT